METVNGNEGRKGSSSACAQRHELGNRTNYLTVVRKGKSKSAGGYITTFHSQKWPVTPSVEANAGVESRWSS